MTSCPPEPLGPTRNRPPSHRDRDRSAIVTDPADDSVRIRDHQPETGDFREEVLLGLSERPRSLPTKYLYDERGAELFEEICTLPEYYPTRTELAIMRAHGDAIVDRLGPECLLVEYGTGEGIKTRLLLEKLERPVAYVPVDIARAQLGETARELSDRFPDLRVLPVCADYTRPVPLPDVERETRRNVVYFPGSTIGNFEPAFARRFLGHVRAMCRPRGALLIGVDLQKDRATLEDAYNDECGVTAAFNRNLLVRINRELGADFDVDRFRHRAFYDEDAGRIEMHLVSEADQTVHLDGTELSFREGESICTEYSYKYTLEGFAELAEAAGLSVEEVWTDPDELFSVQYLTLG